MGLVAKAFQDIITFSRNSNGTYVNSNGYITNSAVSNYLGYSNQPENALWTKSNSFVQQNLLTYSQEFDNAAWIVPSGTIGPIGVNSTVAPDGTLTADTVSATSVNATFWQTYSPTAGAVYTGSIWLKRKTGTGAVSVTADGVAFTAVDLSSGGWVRGTQSYTAAIGTKAVGIRIATSGDEVYVWGAQLVLGSVPGDYRATTSAALPCLYADYNGALRARKLCENTANTVHAVLQTTATIAANSQQTFSIYLRSGERTKGRLFCCNGAATNGFQCDFDLVAGTATAGANVGTGTIIGAPTITNIGNGYYRVSLTGIIDAVSTTGGGYVYLRDAGGAASYTGDGSSGIYIADAQLNDGSAATAYWDNATGSATYAPRFDYDPATLAAKGLLVEESRANLLVQSNDFQTSWNSTNITRTLNSILSPSGNVDGVKIAATAAAATALNQTAVVAATSATGSVFVKQGTSATVANTFQLRNSTTATNLIVGTLNYSTGVFTYTTGSTGVVVTNAGNGYWRISVTATAGITSGDTLIWYVGWAGAVATAGDFLYAYGAQLEAGAFATSYIQTVASQVTRAADVASVNTLSPWYNSVAGTLYAEVDYIASAAGSVGDYNASVSDGTTTNIILLASVTGTVGQVISGGTTTFNQTIGSRPAIGVTQKNAIAYAANDTNNATNGTAGTTDTTVTVPTAITKLNLGNRGDLLGYLNGHLRRITYYPRRLTNAELQTLTTL